MSKKRRDLFLFLLNLCNFFSILIMMPFQRNILPATGIYYNSKITLNYVERNVYVVAAYDY